MASHQVVLRSREAVAEGTMMFRFSRPPGFNFAAGQAVDLALVNPPEEPNSSHRLLSLVSAPFEAELVVATRMRDASAFKRALGTLQPGATVKLKGPLGVMTLHDDPARGAIFIAGGIGITPFMSMLRQAAHDRSGHRFFLLYSNRHPEQAAFLHELRSLEGQYDHFHLLARMTDRDGFIDEETIKAFTASAQSPLYYLAGPPAMADAMTRILRGSGIKDGEINSEEFYGY
jgi:ferredoxin-NADP reductase